MAIYEYECPVGHVSERVRKYVDRDLSVVCHCGKDCRRIEISKPHIEPDGIYSYSPNVGNPARFERQQHAIKNGIKVIKREG